MKNENSPRVRFDTAKNFFHRLEKEKFFRYMGRRVIFGTSSRAHSTTHGLVKAKQKTGMEITSC